MSSDFFNPRILHLVRSMHVGGLEKVVLELTAGLARQGIVSHLGCLLDAGEWAERATVEGTWIGDLGQRGPLPVLCRLCHYIKQQRIDVIHTHNSHPHKYGVAASILTGVPLVHTKHGRNWPDNPKWVWLSRQLSRFTKVIIPVSSDIARIVTEIEKVPVHKVVTILNGVAMPPRSSGELPKQRIAETTNPRTNESTSPRIPELQHGRQCLGLHADHFIIGSVGRFSAEKQYPWLVDVFAEFHRHVPGSLLMLIGDGPERQRIEAAVQRHGIAAAVCLPGVQDNVSDWLACMDVFCLSSDQEGTSMTLLEAGARGLPAVVTDVGGNGEIVVEGQTGLLVPCGGVQAMEDALRCLFEHPEKRLRMARAAREQIASRYSLDAMVTQYAEVYRSAMGRAYDLRGSLKGVTSKPQHVN